MIFLTKENLLYKFKFKSLKGYKKPTKWQIEHRIFNNCTFPFIYNGKTQEDCIFDEDYPTLGWCSITKNYDWDGQRRSCFNKSLSIAKNYYVFTLV